MTEAVAVEGATVTTAATAGVATVAVIGVIVLVTGATIYLLSQIPPVEGAPDRDAGAELPGGVSNGPVTDPTTPAPAKVPGQDQTPALMPGQDQTPALAPSQPVSANVDDPAECARLNSAGQDHDHHIFPVQFRNEFTRILINVDEFTITIPAAQHIGSTGIHVVFDWNGEWQDFLDEIPDRNLTKREAQEWQTKARDLATELLNRAGMANLPIHPYGSL